MSWEAYFSRRIIEIGKQLGWLPSKLKDYRIGPIIRSNHPHMYDIYCPHWARIIVEQTAEKLTMHLCKDS